MFMENKPNISGQAFEMFVSSVLKQIAAQENKDIFLDYLLPKENEFIKDGRTIKLDAAAPNGILGIDTPVFFEYKYQINERTFLNILSRISREYKDTNYVTPVTIIIVTFSTIKHEIEGILESINFKFKGISIDVLDGSIVEDWIQKYPIDYNNAISFYDEKLIDAKSSVAVNNKNFDEKTQDNIAVLKKEIDSNDCFALVLGAGISIDLGAKSWNDLLLHFENELCKAGIIGDVDKLCKKVGGSSLITAQLCKDLYKNETAYYWAIHNGLYGTPSSKSMYAIDEIVKIIEKSKRKKHFRVLTYNFDDYLEQRLTNIQFEFNTLFNSSGIINDKLSIYHVHGYLPQVEYKSYMKPEHCASIFLTEENYNGLYNQPYSWQISSQLSFFRENTCLFVGCSLSDPNIRRLLELTREKNRKHYAIMVKDNLLISDLIIASKHFARLGVEIIWVNNYSDITTVLRQLHS